MEYETQGSVPFIVNLLRYAGISARYVRGAGEICRFTVRYRDAKKAEEVLASRNKPFRVRGTRSVRAFAEQNLGRVGVYAGVTVVMLLLFLWSGTVTTVRIGGLKRLSEEEILSVVYEKTSFPARKSGLDLAEMERALIAAEGVSNAALRVKGNVLYVEILEEADPPQVVDYAEGRDVVSRFDGVVTRVVRYSGTPVVRAGDTVRKGDVLIAACRREPDGTVVKERALGDVYARVWVTEERVYTNTRIVRERTGKSVSYLSAARSEGKCVSPYDAYDTEKSRVFSVRGTQYGLTKTTYFEVTEKEVPFDYEREKSALIAAQTEALEKALPADAEKVRTWFMEKTVDKSTLLVIYYEIVVKISDA